MYLLKLNNSRKNWAARGPARAFRARVCFGPGRFVLGPAREWPEDVRSEPARAKKPAGWPGPITLGPRPARPETGPARAELFTAQPGPVSGRKKIP